MWTLATVGLVVSIAVILVYRTNFGATLSEEHEAWGQFGDYLGGVLGPVIALLALIALLITLYLQSQELTASIKEFRTSAEALTLQNSSLNLQNFENRFFSMLSLHHEIVNGMDLSRAGRASAKGRNCLRSLYYILRENLAAAARGDHGSYMEGILFEYDFFYDDHGHKISHYYQNFYRILKFIDESTIENRRDYSGILRAQLSNPELGLLFYNGITKHGEKLKLLAEEYALFENMELDILNRREVDMHFYNRAAYGDKAVKTLGLDR